MIKNISVVILIAIILFFSISSFVSISQNDPYELKELNYTFKVKETVAFNLDSDKLHFGGAPPGVVLERTLDISSPYDALVHIDSSGLGLITTDKNDFDVSNGENVTVTFFLEVPHQPLGAYEGTILLSFYAR